MLKDLQKTSPQATEDSVRQLWKSRKKIRYQTASYGLGTWLLGKAAALKGYEDEAEEARGGIDPDAYEALEVKIKRSSPPRRSSRARRRQG